MATALVTGASAGLGEEFVWQLATAGHDVVLVARSGDRLSELADVIRSATGVGAEVLVADLSTEAGRAAVEARILDDAHPVSMVVNNAGFGLGEGFLQSTWEDERAVLDVMVTATLQLSHAAAKAMTARGHGAIVNISSIAAHLANSTYAAHKRWILDFTEALAGQLKGTGVSATVVVPGLVRTEFHDAESLEHMKTDYPDVAWLTPDVVVTAALAGVRRKQVVVTPSARYLAAAGLLRLVPKSLTRRGGSKL
ncbi:SDR family NAD(P)-dependent oxidoreductase [Demequina aurantiaca]|uniref:SDR family NAD(P)-dependent oxidoreductase n=1 Tax=Demequina aurantiaca TaxID=676200 RepID=UPI000786647D|nr:SDR family NAD(P)-dependent oxidoreductase [Demequina aurantiaca]